MILMLAMLATVAFLYASVGHGGASGYLAVMALLGFAPALMKSSALIMNLAVSLFSFIGFYRAGHFKIKLFWPFAIASIPMSFLGATYTLPDSIYKKILAVCILISIVRMLVKFEKSEHEVKEIPLFGALLTGAVSALFIFVNSVSGLIGSISKGTLVVQPDLVYAVLATIAGGMAGAYYGSHRFNIPTLRYMLALGLVIACLKLIFA